MPIYDDVKSATISLLDTYSHDHNIESGYGRPVSAPKYSAETKLASVGINAYVRRAMMKPTNKYMRAKFPSAWQAVGASDLAEPDTIGAFIKLMCSCARVAVPNGEPT